ncbi:DegV family protein [Mycoplasmopsis agalactiae]|uniref:DegV family protein n=1 Tax=Mycoplasmopsis agalactiae TaxID=2110 RepID=UPI001F99F5D7|nr:DegV family protein [Mycoplasmopsis agalactiae]MCE6057067.1 DegV family protein [Mycoplasmopsis agalactiae]MCE6078853.1 DegV family protein [Mycoplasmopsis agalactiae]MCE6095238.1 DegV family protein [Mycoplasmopsis agalactiae]
MSSKKLGFVFDSFTCMSKDFLDKHNYGYAPFITTIDDNSYVDGIELSQKEVIEKIKAGKELKSSMPTIESFTKAIEAKSKECGDVLVLGISSCLSSAYNTAKLIAKDYPNVHVYDNTWGAEQYLVIAEYISKVYEANDGNMDIVFAELDKIQESSLIFVLPPNVDYVIKGGRVSSLRKFLLSAMRLLTLKPYVKFYMKKTTTGGIAKSMKSGIKQIIKKFIDFANISSNKNNANDWLFHIAHGVNDEYNQQVLDAYKAEGLEIASKCYVSSAVAVHTGPEAICFMLMPNLSKWPIK